MNKFRWEKKYLYWGMTAFAVIIGCICFFMVIQKWSTITSAVSTIFKILSPFIWGMVITYLLNPMTVFFQKKLFEPLTRSVFQDGKTRIGISRAIAITTSLIFMGLIIAVLLWLVLPQMYSSIESIVKSVPDYVQTCVDWVNKVLENNPDMESTMLKMLNTAAENITQWLQTAVLSKMDNVMSGLSTGIYNVFKTLMNILIGVVVSCYVLYNKERFAGNTKRVLYSIFPTEKVEMFLSGLDFTNRAFTGFINGKILDSAIIGILCWIGCAMLSIPYVTLISVIVGITNVIPFFGPFIGAIPSAIIIFTESPVKCLIFIVFVIVLQQIDGNIIGPRILGNSTGLSGFWVMFAIIVGNGLFGITGMILGVPVLAVIQAGARTIINKRLKNLGLPDETSDYVNLDHIDMETRQPVKKELQSEPPAASKQKNTDWRVYFSRLGIQLKNMRVMAGDWYAESKSRRAERKGDGSDSDSPEAGADIENNGAHTPGEKEDDTDGENGK